MKKYLIINADDLGMSTGINRGILKAHLDGVVSSTTVMANMPHTSEGIRLVQEEAPSLGLGLHFNLTYGRPVLPPERVSSLVQPDGTFHSIDRFLDGVVEYRIDHIRAEMQAQLDRFIEISRATPDHFDSHHFFAYLQPVAFDTLLKLSSRHKVPVRNGAVFMNAAMLREALEHIQIRLPDTTHLVNQLRNVYAANVRPRWPASLEMRFYDESATTEMLHTILQNLPAGVTEVMCHPGYADDLESRYALQREREIVVLTDASIRDFLAEADIDLITFAELPLV
ncbi:MAG: ChbG/HpnK family deacetylase [Chloroflexi bacterium]|nr:ChbG/HpnK family deacetylase [Chloroflexota bacterium]